MIAPAFTYVAGHQAISRTGADVVFCDVEPDNLSIDSDTEARCRTNDAAFADLAERGDVVLFDTDWNDATVATASPKPSAGPSFSSTATT